jgi:hypothetical protein
LSHSANPVLSWVFSEKGSQESSWVARIIIVSHQCLALS